MVTSVAGATGSADGVAGAVGPVYACRADTALSPFRPPSGRLVSFLDITFAKTAFMGFAGADILAIAIKAGAFFD